MSASSAATSAQSSSSAVSASVVSSSLATPSANASSLSPSSDPGAHFSSTGARAAASSSAGAGPAAAPAGAGWATYASDLSPEATGVLAAICVIGFLLIARYFLKRLRSARHRGARFSQVGDPPGADGGAVEATAGRFGTRGGFGRLPDDDDPEADQTVMFDSRA